MKKTLTISFNSGNYLISDGTEKVIILGTDLILKGQDLFDKFYKDFKKEDSFELTVEIDSSVVDSKDKYIASEIQKILNEINEKLAKVTNNKANEMNNFDEEKLIEEEIAFKNRDLDLENKDEEITDVDDDLPF